MISTKYKDKVAIISLDREVTNALNLQLLNELSEALNHVKQDAGTQSLVLTSSNDKFFSIGFDIPQLIHLPKEEFGYFYKTFNQVYTDLLRFPKPTVAAITGHATAGGCILALCCDYRFIAEGRKLMGLNEVKLGVPVPYPVACVLTQIVGARIAREIMYTGDFYPPEDLFQMGMVDQVLPLGQVLPQSMEKARLLGALPQEAFSSIKRNLLEPVEAQILGQVEGKEQLFIDLWYSEDVRQRLREAVEKF